jgi:hypothetical protein
MLEVYHGQNTYSKKTGSKRKPQRVQPNLYYHASQEALTDKQVEHYLVQHKMMAEFLSSKGLIESYNEFQKRKQIEAGDYVEWFKKWN